MKQFRTLRPDEIECRVAQCNEKGASILLYKTARTDADILDETVGAQNWENDFKLVDGVLYGGIGIDYVGNGKLIWKWDAGTESNTEAEKGRASDAFKRAGFKHGIGRELYSAPFIWIDAAKCERLKLNDRTKKWQCYDQFDVTEISYDEAERIKTLTLALKGKTVYTDTAQLHRRRSRLRNPSSVPSAETMLFQFPLTARTTPPERLRSKPQRRRDSACAGTAT